MAESKNAVETREFDTLVGRLSLPSSQVVVAYNSFSNYYFLKHAKDLVTKIDEKMSDIVVVQADFKDLEASLNGHQESWDIFSPPAYVDQALSNFFNIEEYTVAFDEVKKQITNNTIVFDMVDAVLSWAEGQIGINIEGIRNRAALGDLGRRDIDQAVNQIYNVLRLKGEPGRFKSQLRSLFKGDIVSAETLSMLGEHVDPRFHSILEDPYEEAQKSKDYSLAAFVQKAIGRAFINTKQSVNFLDTRYKGNKISERDFYDQICAHFSRIDVDLGIARLKRKEPSKSLLEAEALNYSRVSRLPENVKTDFRSLENIATDMIILTQIFADSIFRYVEEQNPGYDLNLRKQISGFVIHDIVPSEYYFHIICEELSVPSQSIQMSNPKTYAFKILKEYQENKIPTIFEDSKTNLSVKSLGDAMLHLTDILPPELLDAMYTQEIIKNPKSAVESKHRKPLNELRRYQIMHHDALTGLDVNIHRIPDYSHKFPVDRKRATISNYFNMQV